MKTKTKTAGNVCPRCGGMINPATSRCSVCGSTGQKQPPAPAEEKRIYRVLDVLFSVIFGLLLSVSVMLFVILLFVYALNENGTIPAIGFISGDRLNSFLDSPFSLVLGGVPVLIPVLVIVFINSHRIRRCFLVIGCSAFVSAALCMTAVILRTQMLQSLSAQWQEALINATSVFGDFCVVCALILIAVGAACLSIYSCIAVIKGGKHEKNT